MHLQFDFTQKFTLGFVVKSVGRKLFINVYYFLFCHDIQFIIIKKIQQHFKLQYKPFNVLNFRPVCSVLIAMLLVKFSITT